MRKNDVGSLLREKREASGLSRDRAGKLLGLKSGQYIYMIETGRRIPGFDFIKKLARIYGLKIKLEK